MEERTKRRYAGSRGASSGVFPLHSYRRAKKLFIQLADFLADKGNTPDVFIFTGFAGTGKTTCLRAVQQTAASLGYRVLLLAPTGRAAKIISKHTGQKAHTLHRQLYYQKQPHYREAGEHILRVKENYLPGFIN